MAARRGKLRPMARYRPQLDSLRAFAVTAVLVSHFWIAGMPLASPLGITAVRLFFVLSGFLLTSILLGERAEGARAGVAGGRLLGNFYVRRILRIWPAYYTALAAAVLFGATGVAATLGWHAAFGSNILFFIEKDWFPEVTGHLWTLAVEEQFYLLLPLVVLFAPRRMLRTLLVAGIAAAIAYRLIIASQISGSFEFYDILSIAQLDALCGGALLAELRDSGRSIRWKKLLAWSLPAAMILHLLPLPDIVNYPLVPAAYVIAMAAAVAGAQEGVGGLAGAVLDNRVVIGLGRISYGVYLYHPFVAVAFNASLVMAGRPAMEGGALAFFLWSALSIAVAAASWFLLERPALSLRRRFRLGTGTAAVIPAAPTPV